MGSLIKMALNLVAPTWLVASTATLARDRALASIASILEVSTLPRVAGPSSCQAEWDWAMHLVRWLAKCSCGCNTMTLGQTWKNEGVSWVCSTFCHCWHAHSCGFLSHVLPRCIHPPRHICHASPGRTKNLNWSTVWMRASPFGFPNVSCRVPILWVSKKCFFPGWEPLSYTWVYVKFISRHHVMPAWSSVRDPAHSTW